MKKTVSLLLAFFIICSAVFCTVSCSDAGDDKLSIVTTVFPAYDWTREILGDNPKGAELTMLLDSGVDLHSYQPTVPDLAKIASCDVFIYVGGESDGWVENALAAAKNEDMVVINMMEVLGDAVFDEEISEGMEHEDEDGEEHEHEADEHIWLSLSRAVTVCNYIAVKMGEVDTENAQSYLDNAKDYAERLTELDGRYRAAVSEAARDTLLFADRFSFRYLTEDYGLNYYAAFSGCSAETEASFETIVFLAGKVDELGLTSVMVIEGSDGSIADTVISAASSDGITVRALNSMQSVTSRDVENGVTYIQIMESNLSVLTDALN